MSVVLEDLRGAQRAGLAEGCVEEAGMLAGLEMLYYVLRRLSRASSEG